MKSEHSTEKVLEMDKQIQELFHKFGKLMRQWTLNLKFGEVNGNDYFCVAVEAISLTLSYQLFHGLENATDTQKWWEWFIASTELKLKNAEEEGVVRHRLIKGH